MKNPQAFPTHPDAPLSCDGMTLRDYMAAKAMQAQISLPETLFAISKKTITADQICGSCYEWADAMLKAREV